METEYRIQAKQWECTKDRPKNSWSQGAAPKIFVAKDKAPSDIFTRLLPSILVRVGVGMARHSGLVPVYTFLHTRTVFENRRMERNPYGSQDPDVSHESPASHRTYDMRHMRHTTARSARVMNKKPYTTIATTRFLQLYGERLGTSRQKVERGDRPVLLLLQYGIFGVIHSNIDKLRIDTSAAVDTRFIRQTITLVEILATSNSPWRKIYRQWLIG